MEDEEPLKIEITALDDLLPKAVKNQDGRLLTTVENG